MVFFSDTNLVASKQIQIPKMFQERPLLTLDYVADYKSEHQGKSCGILAPKREFSQLSFYHQSSRFKLNITILLYQSYFQKNIYVLHFDLSPSGL